MLGLRLQQLSSRVRPCHGRLAVVMPHTAPVSSAPERASTNGGLFYDGLVFDMDGTLTEAHIPFGEMRQRTVIPEGDLFTVMESWEEPGKVQAAMEIILQMEADASKLVSAKPGLIELLTLIKERQVPLALVTRNTTASVDAFFKLIGEEWRCAFSQVLTREFKYVKPDKRLLLHVAEVWGLQPSRLLMVGDSFEDVEVANSAGSASCFVAGGGNEKPGARIEPPAGAIPTFSVKSLHQLADMLTAAGRATTEDAAAGISGSTVQASTDDTGGVSRGLSDAGAVRYGWPELLAAGEKLDSAGAPPPGLDLFDWLVEAGALRPAEVSFPRMGAAAGGMATCQQFGTRLVHLGCGLAAFTKLLACQGMQPVGVDMDVTAAIKRGVAAVPFSGTPFARGSLAAVRKLGAFDTALIYGTDMSEAQQLLWWRRESLLEIRSTFQQGGFLAAQVPLHAAVNPAAVLTALAQAGFVLTSWGITDLPSGQQLRVCARAVGLRPAV